MKKILGLIVLGAFTTATWAMAASAKSDSKSTTSTQPAAKAGPKYAPHTGDKDLDVVLSNLNVEAGVHVDAFVSELSISYTIPKVQIEALVYTMRMPFGDVFVSVWLGGWDGVIQLFWRERPPPQYIPVIARRAAPKQSSLWLSAGHDGAVSAFAGLLTVGRG